MYTLQNICIPSHFCLLSASSHLSILTYSTEFLILELRISCGLWDQSRTGKKLTWSFHGKMEAVFSKFSGVQSRHCLKFTFVSRSTSFSLTLFLHAWCVRSFYFEIVFEWPCVILFSIYSIILIEYFLETGQVGSPQVLLFSLVCCHWLSLRS